MVGSDTIYRRIRRRVQQTQSPTLAAIEDSGLSHLHPIIPPLLELLQHHQHPYMPQPAYPHSTVYSLKLPRLLWHGRFRPSFPGCFLQTSTWKRSGTDRIFPVQFRPESGCKEPAGTCWNRRKLCRNREELCRNQLRFQRIQSPE
ncbi:unnamed protein product [Adineta ricciae]|uniref:Uncharacterized protein n=1 Tax=Adineta ricciae TaxID=249248 RepID=A0A814MME4_ADIRI|nr:unnamed protein product [Adineta ricciae]CAF1185740.1 unnamed protein product [Adineta ricciae]